MEQLDIKSTGDRGTLPLHLRDADVINRFFVDSVESAANDLPNIDLDLYEDGLLTI